MKFAWVPAGPSFLSGGKGNIGQEEFILEYGFWCAIFPVTQAQWQALMGENPSRFRNNPEHPVESVSWNRTQEFIGELNRRERVSGLVFRLPTEKEWEYVCRGGPLPKGQSKFDFYFAKSRIDLSPVPTYDLAPGQANFHWEYPAGSASKGKYLRSTSPVGSFLPNSLGIFDLHGNVWEWTTTIRNKDRVCRGGSWSDRGEKASATHPHWKPPEYANEDIGFRLLAIPQH